MLRQTVVVARCTQKQATCAFSTTMRSRKDFVQEMYLKELKAYKPPPQAKDAHVGVVRAFSAPSSPKAPQLPSDLASELSQYESTNPTAAEAHTTTTSSSPEDGGGGAKDFLAFLESDLPKAGVHH